MNTFENTWVKYNNEKHKINMTKMSSMSDRILKKIHLRKHLETKFIPWTQGWLRVHFNYTDHIINENYIPPTERHTEYILKHKETDFAKLRANHHYSNIENNTRDLGGYFTKSGKYQVKSGLLFRSNALCNLSNSQLSNLNNLHITKVIDLRDLHEAKQAPDSNQINSEILHYPVYTKKGVNRNRNMTMKYGVIYRYNTLFFSNQHAKKAYYNIFKCLLSNHTGATLYHCTEGRDRTGTTSALILSALGVGKHTIMNDYLLTNYYSNNKPFFRQYHQLKTFFKAIHDNYGTTDKYLNSCGISSQDIKALKSMYLTKVMVY